MTTPAPGQPLAPGVISAGLIGAGRMGSFHAETLARRLPGTGRTPAVTGQDARAALAVARAAIQSVTTGGPVRIDELKDE